MGLLIYFSIILFKFLVGSRIQYQLAIYLLSYLNEVRRDGTRELQCFSLKFLNPAEWAFDFLLYSSMIGFGCLLQLGCSAVVLDSKV